MVVMITQHLESKLFTAFYKWIFSHESLLSTSFFKKEILKKKRDLTLFISYLCLYIGSHIFHGSIEINIELFSDM